LPENVWKTNRYQKLWALPQLLRVAAGAVRDQRGNLALALCQIGVVPDDQDREVTILAGLRASLRPPRLIEGPASVVDGAEAVLVPSHPRQPKRVGFWR
jgi:hypothetical protein